MQLEFWKWDKSEIIGLVGIIIGIIGSLIQLNKTHKTQNVTSFSFMYLVLIFFSEFMYLSQGVMKHSGTMVATRVATCTWYLYLLIMWVNTMKKNDPETSGSSSPSK